MILRAYERVVADLGTVYSMAYRPQDKRRMEMAAIKATADQQCCRPWRMGTMQTERLSLQAVSPQMKTII